MGLTTVQRYCAACDISTTLDVTEIIFAVLFVSLMGLTRCYKTTVFLHLLIQ